MASLSALSVMGERKSGQSIRQQNVMAAQVEALHLLVTGLVISDVNLFLSRFTKSLLSNSSSL